MPKELKIKDVFQTPEKEGDFGLEIEVEGINLPTNGHIRKYWRRHNDGSLRGRENAEYVINGPVTRPVLSDALQELKKAYKDCNSRLDDTVTAGVHVHLNFQQSTLIQLYTFITLYYCVEDLLLRFCGESREGNHFCLRAKDADYVIGQVVQSVQRMEPRVLASENVRYAALNYLALANYGSLEFRSMRSTEDLSVIELWCDILMTLKISSEKFKDPKDVIMAVSQHGARQFIHNVFGEYSDLFVEMDNYQDEIHSGMRYAQDIAFAISDWSDINDKKKVLKYNYGHMAAAYNPDPPRFIHDRGEEDQIVKAMERLQGQIKPRVLKKRGPQPIGNPRNVGEFVQWDLEVRDDGEDDEDEEHDF